MATGIEAIGLVLAVFPVATELVHTFSGAVSGREIRYLSESIQNQQRIFLNSVESLFRSIVTAGELRELLEDKTCVSWQDDNLNKKVTDQLGQQADGLLEIASKIHRTLEHLQKELLKLRASDLPEQRRMDRVKLIIKAFTKGPKHKASLEKLKSQIRDFRAMTEGTLQLAPERQGDRQAIRIRNVHLVQNGANTLYDTLRDGLSCDCVDPHPAHMKLDIWSPEEKGDTICLKFSFLFADNAEAAHENHWRVAEMESTRTAMSSDPNQARPENIPSTSRVQFMPSEPILRSPTSIDPNHSIDGKPDLCGELMGRSSDQSTSCRKRVGSVSSADGNEYKLFTAVNQISTPISSKILLDVLSSNTSQQTGRINAKRATGKLSTKQRIELARLLAWAVLQLSQTNWLEGHWTKENILLVRDSSNNLQPYISHRFFSSRKRSDSDVTSTLIPVTSHQYERWVANEALFALAIFLLEMGYHCPIEDLAEEEERSPSSHLTTVLTAQRLAKDVHNEMGMHYEKAVKACLRGLHDELNADSVQHGQDARKMAQGILQQVIEPLDTVARSF